METKARDKKKRAMQRVKELKGFYVHGAVFCIVNTFISVNKIIRNMGNGESFSEAFWDLGTFFIWIFWGIGLAFHATKVFGYGPFFNKEWEKRQIEKYMQEDAAEAQRFKRIGRDYGK